MKLKTRCEDVYVKNVNEGRLQEVWKCALCVLFTELPSPKAFLLFFLLGLKLKKRELMI